MDSLAAAGVPRGRTFCPNAPIPALFLLLSLPLLLNPVFSSPLHAYDSMSESLGLPDHELALGLWSMLTAIWRSWATLTDIC